MKFAEMLEERNNIRARLEVYREVLIYLQEFVSTDNRPAKKSIEYSGAAKEFVPEYIIEEIVEDIDSKYVQPLTDQLTDIEQKEI